MAKQVQRRRQTTANLRSVTGAVGELLVDTERHEVLVMDGTTPGGHALPRMADLYVRELADLPDPVDGEITLPSGLVVLKGTIDLGANALRLSEGTLLRGFGAARIQSSATGGVLRCSGLDAAVVLREFSIIATGGPCLNLSGPIGHQLNVFFCGLFGASVGTVTGFDVQGFKDCFFNCADGLSLAGTTNKVFVSGSVFYGVTGSNAGLTLDASLNASVVDIVTTFWKYESGVGIRAASGYTVGDGIIRGALVDGDLTPLDGLAPSDVQWKMTDNTGIRDSRVAGAFWLTESAATTISAVNTPVKIAGTTTAAALNERMSNGNNRLTYTGKRPALVAADLTFAIDADSNNQALNLYIARNGTVLPESVVRVRIGTGSDERNGATTALVEMETDDYLEAWVENTTSDADVEVLALTLTARA